MSCRIAFLMCSFYAVEAMVNIIFHKINHAPENAVTLASVFGALYCIGAGIAWHLMRKEK